MLVPLFALGKMRFSSSVAQWSLLACGGFALFSFVDFPSRTPACLTLFVVTFACSLKYGSGSHSGTVDSKSSLPNRANVN
jgi:hypothetical protein